MVGCCCCTRGGGAGGARLRMVWKALVVAASRLSASLRMSGVLAPLLPTAAALRLACSMKNGAKKSHWG